MMASIAIRVAAPADAEPIARLVTELGYPTSSSQMSERLRAVLRDEDYDTLVAHDAGQILGFIGTRVGPLYESDDRYGQIMVLSVASGHRRRGIGRMLVQAAESILADRGARVLVVTTGNQRADAHAFYEKNGYTFTGRRYRKSLAS
jgi:ribosomal protein S18 acetylase RimI-like enzyme